MPPSNRPSIEQELEKAHTFILQASGIIVGMIIHRKYRASFRDTAIRQLKQAIEMLEKIT